MKAPLTLCLTLACALALPLARPRAQSDGLLESREAIRLQHEIEELHHEVQGLRDQLAQGAQAGGGSSLGGYQTPPPPPSGTTSDMMAQLLSRVQRLEEDVRALRGRIDEVDNTREQQYEDLNKQIGDLKFRLGIDTGTPGTAPAGTGAPPAPGQSGSSTMSPPPGNLGAETASPAPPKPPAAPPRRTPEMLLQEGHTALGRKDYALAIADAKAVVAAGGPRAVDGQLLMARALYAKRDFAGAAVAYDDTYKRNRKGLHAPDALLGVAASLTAIGEKPAACQALQRLTAEFPKLREDLRVSAGRVRRDAGCH